MLDLWTILTTLALGVVSVVGLFFTIMPFQFLSQKAHDIVNMMPGPKFIPVFGSMFEFNLKHEEVLPKIIQMAELYGKTFKIWILGNPTIFLLDPDDVETVVSNIKYIDKSIAYTFLHPWLGTGLLTSTGSKWQRRRKILTPAFHFKILEQYVEVFNRNSAILVDKLALTQGKVVEVNSYVTLCALDIICETAMGTPVHAQRGGQPEYCSATRRMSDLFQHRYMSFWIHKDWIYRWTPSGREQKKVLKVLHGFTDKVIKQRRAEYREKKSAGTEIKEKKKLLTFLDLLIEESETKQELKDQDIREEVDTFMFEGHDTTAAAVSWTLFALGHNPDVQEKIFEELQEKFGSMEPFAPTQSELQDLPYLDRVIKESLRLFPSVPAISRFILHDVPLKNGYTMPAGSNCAMFPYLMHRDPKYFPDPHRFNPDNFLPERVVGRHPYVYMPFSAGHRNCIGQKFAMVEEKALLSAVLRKFTVTSVEKREDIKILMEMILTPQQPLKLIFTPRNND